MASDFAKQRPQQPHARKGGKPASRSSGQGSAWNWFVSGVFAGILLTAGSYIGFLRYQALEQGALESGANTQSPAQLPNFDFGFYQELATAEVAVGATEEATNNASPVTAPPTDPETANDVAQATVNYLLQAGSFQDKQEAEERRAKIILMNMATEVMPGVVGGRTWYRVQVGPFAGRDSAEEARKLLSASNIDSIPLLMR